MVMTILIGRVSPERWTDLETAYRRGIRSIPRQLIQTFLVQSETDPNQWEIVSIWRSREAYEEAKKTEEASTCVGMFHDAGVEPTRQCFDIVAQHMKV